MDQLIRSSVKAWNLGKEGKAEFLESSLNGVETAEKFRGNVILNIQHIARVIFLDPEKTVEHAQSGRAMEVLHGPLVELVEELQPMVERTIINLILKNDVDDFAIK